MTWKLLLMVVLLLPARLACCGEPLSESKRGDVLDSLQAYQTKFKNNRVSIGTHTLKNFMREGSRGQGRQDYRIVVDGPRIYTEYEYGRIGHIVGFGPQDDGADRGRETIKASFNLITQQGKEISVRDDDGTITQAKKIQKSVGIGRFTSMRLAQALGWLEFWPRWRGSMRLLDPAFIVENAQSLRRVDRADGKSEIHAEYVNEHDIVFQMRFSGLPDVRLFYIRTFYPQHFDIAGQIRYQETEGGFMAPSAIRELRTRFTDGKRELVLAEEAVVVNFEMLPADQAGEFPTIEIPEGVRIIGDAEPPTDAAESGGDPPAVPVADPEVN